MIRQAIRNRQGERFFTVQELDWFCKNAYNIGLENVSSWQPVYLVRILRCCLGMISRYPEDIGEQSLGDIALRRMFCNFMTAAGLLALARAEDNIEVQLQNYLEMRQHIKKFDDEFEERLVKLDDMCKNDLRMKLATLLVFDFEAAISLKS